jgi:DNA mismatch repair protein MutL
MSFGFRGEAIASIASVSELSIFSRYKNADQAYKYTDGVIEACALNNGSRFEVIDLFSKTPARLNYLKKAKTEYAKIHDFVKSMALAYPEIRFELENDGKTVFNYSPVQKTESRIGQIL